MKGRRELSQLILIELDWQEGVADREGPKITTKGDDRSSTDFGKAAESLRQPIQRFCH